MDNMQQEQTSSRTNREQMGSIKDSMQECIRQCQECHNVCLQTLQYSLQQGGNFTEMQQLQVLMDCATICTTSADFMLRESERHRHICAICAEICKDCEEACEEFADDEQLTACADACRSCFKSCQEMAV